MASAAFELGRVIAIAGAAAFVVSSIGYIAENVAVASASQASEAGHAYVNPGELDETIKEVAGIALADTVLGLAVLASSIPLEQRLGPAAIQRKTNHELRLLVEGRADQLPPTPIDIVDR
ncbi:MAG: hypothetical protein WDN27_06055 [Candidatus Saccharibacteria bacterium]